MVLFHSHVAVYQRVSGKKKLGFQSYHFKGPRLLCWTSQRQELGFGRGLLCKPRHEPEIFRSPKQKLRDLYPPFSPRIVKLQSSKSQQMSPAMFCSCAMNFWWSVKKSHSCSSELEAVYVTHCWPSTRICKHIAKRSRDLRNFCEQLLGFWWVLWFIWDHIRIYTPSGEAYSWEIHLFQWAMISMGYKVFHESAGQS